MTKREEREHLFKLLFCKDFHDVEELKEQVELYQSQQEVGKEEEFTPVKAKLEAVVAKEGEIDMMDLIQEANMALVMAVSMYDGGSFEELILTEIQRAIEDALAEAGSQADVGGYLASQINSLMIVTARLAEELGREATLSELSEKMHMPEDKVRELVKMAMDAMSLQEDEQISPELS